MGVFFFGKSQFLLSFVFLLKKRKISLFFLSFLFFSVRARCRRPSKGLSNAIRVADVRQHHSEARPKKSAGRCQEAKGYCTGIAFSPDKKIFTLLHLPSHPALRSRAAGSRRTRRVRMKQRTKETKARFRVRPLPGFLQRNRRQIRTQRGPLTPKPPSFSL